MQYSEAFALGRSKVEVAQETARVAQIATDLSIMTMDPSGLDECARAWYDKCRQGCNDRADAAVLEREVQRAVSAEVAAANTAAIAQLRALEHEARNRAFWADISAANGVADLEDANEDVVGDGENHGPDDGVGAGFGDDVEGGSPESEE